MTSFYREGHSGILLMSDSAEAVVNEVTRRSEAECIAFIRQSPQRSGWYRGVLKSVYGWTEDSITECLSAVFDGIDGEVPVMLHVCQQHSESEGMRRWMLSGGAKYVGPREGCDICKA